MNTKWCAYHSQEESLENFRKKSDGKLESWCIEGKREYGRNRAKELSKERKQRTIKQRLEYESRLSQICTRCERDKPIEEFAFRSDRPTRRNSRCKSCWSEVVKERNHRAEFLYPEKLKEKRRRYQLSHPGYGGGKQRKINLNRVKKEIYTKQEVWEKTKGLCFICEKDLDPDKKWPDPESTVIHHIHPLSKHGPDILKNVVLTHHKCNGSLLNKYDSPFKNWIIKPIDSITAREIVIEYHYLHRKANISYAFACYDENNNWRGIITFGTPSSWRISNSICPDDPNSVIELNRLWIDDSAPFGAASWFVSRALKKLPPRIIVSYADLAENHIGTIYKALSFNYAGQSRPRKEWRLPDRARNVGKIEGAVLCEVTPKNRYWFITGNKRDKKTLQSLIQWPAL